MGFLGLHGLCAYMGLILRIMQGKQQDGDCRNKPLYHEEQCHWPQKYPGCEAAKWSKYGALLLKHEAKY